MTAETEDARRDPWVEMAAAGEHHARALINAYERPHAHAADEVDLRRDEMGLAALALVRHLNAHPDDQPPGWDFHPVDGTPDPDWKGARWYACPSCGEGFRTNADVTDVTCANCETRLCAQCGHWHPEN